MLDDAFNTINWFPPVSESSGVAAAELRLRMSFGVWVVWKRCLCVCRWMGNVYSMICILLSCCDVRMVECDGQFVRCDWSKGLSGFLGWDRVSDTNSGGVRYFGFLRVLYLFVSVVSAVQFCLDCCWRLLLKVLRMLQWKYKNKHNKNLLQPISLPTVHMNTPWRTLNTYWLWLIVITIIITFAWWRRPMSTVDTRCDLEVCVCVCGLFEPSCRPECCRLFGSGAYVCGRSSATVVVVVVVSIWCLSSINMMIWPSGHIFQYRSSGARRLCPTSSSCSVNVMQVVRKNTHTHGASERIVEKDVACPMSFGCARGKFVAERLSEQICQLESFNKFRAYERRTCWKMSNWVFDSFDVDIILRCGFDNQTIVQFNLNVSAL